MKTKTRQVAAMSLAAAGVFLLTGVSCTPQSPAIGHGSHHVEEDEPGWDCHTMGNRICGPTS